MSVPVASDHDSPVLAAALSARGLRLAPMGDPTAQAMLLSGKCCPRRVVARARRDGWLRPLMLLVEDAGQLVDALDAGADEAAMRSADPMEIAARLSARMRSDRSGWRVGDLFVDPVARQATRDGRRLRLRGREFALLAFLARQGGRAVPRRELLTEVWGLDFDPGTNVLQVHVSRLRAQLQAGGGPPLLHTDRGRGYRLATPADGDQPIF